MLHTSKNTSVTCYILFFEGFQPQNIITPVTQKNLQLLVLFFFFFFSSVFLDGPVEAFFCIFDQGC